MKKSSFFLLIVFLVIYCNLFSATYYSITSGNWNTAATWSTSACGGAVSTTVPGAADNVIICSGTIVTMNGNPGACLSLTIYGTANWANARTTNVGTGGLVLDGTGSITGTATGILNVAGAFTVPVSGNVTMGRLTTTVTGATTIVGTITINSTTGTKTFADVTINSSGTWTSTVAPAITMASVTTSGAFNCNSGTYTINNNFSVLDRTTNFEGSIGGTLNVNSGATLNIPTGVFSVTGQTTVSGALNITTTTGTKTLSNITVNTGGQWNATVAAAVTVTGSVISNGSFNCNSGTYTVNTNFSVNAGTTNFEGSIGGTLSVASGATINFPTGNVSVTGTSTISGTLNINTATGTKQFGNIVVTSTGIWDASVVEPVTVNGSITTNGTFDCSAATYTVSGNVAVNAGTLGFQGSIGGTLNISSGAAMNISTSNCAVTGQTTISGNLNFTTATGAKTFSDIMINAGGVWNCSIVEAFTISGNFQNNGTIISNTGVYTFSGTAKTFSGSWSCIFSSISISGSYTNTDSLTVLTNMGGTGTFTQGVNSWLGMGDVTPPTIITATAAGNKVYYFGSVNQTVRAITYHDIEIVSTGGTVTATGTYTVNNNFIVTDGTVSFGSVTVAGNLSVATGSVVNIGGTSPAISGNTVINGTINITGTAGTKTFNNLIVNTTGSWNSSVNEGYIVNGNIQNDGVFTSGNGIYTLAGTGKTLSGVTATSINNITCTGSYTNNFILTVSGSLAGTGTFIQGIGATLNYSSLSSISLFTVAVFDASALGNVVNYTGAGAQNIKNPFAGIYYHLMLSGGAGIKSLTAATIVNGNLSIGSGTILSASVGNYNINLAGNWINDGTFISGTATVTMNGNASQDIGGLSITSFNNLVISNTNAVVTASIDFSSNGTLTITNNAILSPNAAVVVDGTGTLTGTGTARVTRIATTADFLSQYMISNKTLANLTIDYTGAGDQTVNSTNYGTLIISANGTRTVTLDNSSVIAVSGSFSPASANISYIITGSTVDFNGSSSQTIPAFSYNNLTSSSTGDRTLASSGTIGIAEVFNPGANTYTTTGSTVDFNGTAQTIPAFTFYNLLTSAGTKMLSANINIDNTITISGDLDVTAANYSVNVGKDWINNGTFNAQQGTVLFDGNTPQSIGGSSNTTFYNMTLNNNAGASLISGQNLIGTLALTSGTFTTTGQTFTLLSTASRTARIDAIQAGADITGNITMQRYITPGTSGWMLLSTPIIGATLQQWKDDFITGGFPGSHSPSTTNSSIVSYDETLPGVYDDGYVTPSNITDPIIANKGYWAYVLTDSVVVVDVTGPALKNTQTFPVTYTDDVSQPASEDGWNLIANPYPSTIDWDAAGWTKTNVNDAVYVYNPTLDQYTSYVDGIGINGGSNLIASSQGFLVQTNAANPVLEITENAKAPADATFIRSQSVTDDIIKLDLTGNNYKDETVIRFNSNAANSFDDDQDAMKFFSFNSAVPGIATRMGKVNYSVNSLPSLTSDLSIPVKVQVGISGTYTIKLDSLTNLSSSSCLILDDLLTGTKTDLRISPEYSFYIRDTTKAPRFRLHIGNPIQATAASPSCNGSSNGMLTAKGIGAGPWEYIWKDSQNTVVQTHSNINGVDTLFNAPAGSYTVEINGNTSLCGTSLKTIVNLTEPGPILVQANITDASCSTVSDGSITITATTGGQAPYTYNWSDSATTSANMNIAKGTYLLTISDKIGCVKTYTYTVSSNVTVTSLFNMSVDTVDLSNNAPVAFYNTSIGAITYSWDFGDSSPVDNSENPVHTYLMPGTYTVTLTTTNGACSDVITKTVIVQGVTTITENTSLDDYIKVITGDNSIDLIFNFNELTNAVVDVYNSIGQQVVMSKNIKVHKNRISIDIKDKSKGIYYIKIQSGDQIVIKKTVKS
ncbi:MAG: PKD domain-containing protein [Bacteroidota bacterium]